MSDLRVMLSFDGGETVELIEPHPDHLEAVRFSFNPSARNDVAKLKLVAAAFLQLADKAGADFGDGRAAAVAKTNMQTASMWAVFAATKGAPPAPSAGAEAMTQST